MSSADASFLEGLTQPSAASLAGMLVVGAITFAGLAASDGPAALASGVPILRWDDEFADMAGRLVRMRATRPEAPVVWIIGSSATREALTSSHELADAIAESGGPQVAVEILAAGGLYIEESLVVLDHIPLRPGDLVVSEVSPRNLALPAEQLQWLLDSPRLPLDGPTLDQFATAHGLTPHPRIPGSHLLSFPDFWSARMGTIVHAMHGGPRVEFHLSQRAPPPDPHRWDLLIQRVGGWGTRCVANSALHLDGYAAMVERVSATGAALVLLDAPRNPEVLSRIGPEATRDREACQQRIIAFAMANGLERWEPAIGARLLGRDFIDHAHVIAPPARARFTADVANAITRTLGSPP